MPYDKRRGRKERGGAQRFFLSSSATLRVLCGLCVKIFSLKRLGFQNQLGVKRHGGHMIEAVSWAATKINQRLKERLGNSNH